MLLLLEVYENEMGMLDRVCEGPFYSSKGRFPPLANMGTWTTAFWRIRTTFPPKLRLSLFHVGSAEPLWPPLATAFVWVSAWWVLMSDRSVPRLGWSIWSGLWAFFVGMMQCWIFCASVLRLLSVFALFRVWVPANQESPKLVKMVSIKPYNYFWCLKVMKGCRS